MARLLKSALSFFARMGDLDGSLDRSEQYAAVSSEEELLSSLAPEWIGFLFERDSVNVSGVVKDTESAVIDHFFDKRTVGSFSLAHGKGTVYYRKGARGFDDLSSLLSSSTATLLYVRPFDGNRSLTRSELHTLLQGRRFDSGSQGFCSLRSPRFQREF